MQFVTLTNQNVSNIAMLVDMELSDFMFLFGPGDMIELNTWRGRVARWRAQDREKRLKYETEKISKGERNVNLAFLINQSLPENWLAEIGVKSCHPKRVR